MTPMPNKLFIVLLGGRPPESTIEQHNIFCGVGPTIESLFPAIKKFWSTAPKIHIDAYMIVEQVGKYRVRLIPAGEVASTPSASGDEKKLFLMGLGNYRAGEFTEHHKNILVVARDVDEATEIAKQDSFYTFDEWVNDGHGHAMPHVDSKRMLDSIEDDATIDVSGHVVAQGYTILLEEAETVGEPELVITGYLRI